MPTGFRKPKLEFGLNLSDHQLSRFRCRRINTELSILFRSHRMCSTSREALAKSLKEVVTRGAPIRPAAPCQIEESQVYGIDPRRIRPQGVPSHPRRPDRFDSSRPSTEGVNRNPFILRSFITSRSNSESTPTDDAPTLSIDAAGSCA
jgi:hypothetical protein